MSLVRGVESRAPVGPLYTPHRPPETAPGFGGSLDALLHTRGSASPAAASPAPTGSGAIRLSPQASARLEASGVHLDPDDMADLGDAVDQLARRGARESLVLFDDHALFVRVPDRTVTTVMTRREAAQHVFPQIDATVVLR
ncbi:MAG: hypothetical protein Q8P18_19910 [Pseudomonadota bacterium]|nr:hypothetical protein [Pseudomonadota bacterium]